MHVEILRGDGFTYLTSLDQKLKTKADITNVITKHVYLHIPKLSTSCTAETNALIGLS